MTGPVERVARAICEAERMNPDDALGGWVHWTEAAEAAIAANRDDNLEFNIARLELRAGDVLVLKVNQILSQVQHERMLEIVRRINPNIKALVLEKGMDVAVLSREEIDARSSAPSDAEDAA